MALRLSKLHLECLDDRIVPSTTPIEFGLLPPPDYTPNFGSPYEPTPLPPPSGSTGIGPINPLPAGPTPIDPVKELAISQSLTAALAATATAIQNLNPTDPNFAIDLNVLQLRQSLISTAIMSSQTIAANVLSAAALLPQINALAAQIQALQDKPVLTIAEATMLQGLISQYGDLTVQITQLAASTQFQLQLRAQALSVLGIADPYTP